MSTFSSFGLQTCKENVTTPTTMHLVDNHNGMVSDSKTGLKWKKCSEGQSYNTNSNSCDNSAGTYNWSDALKQVQNVNSAIVGENFGQSDWRLPNINELASIVELSCYFPAINQGVFSNTPRDKYWTSSPVAGSTSYIWIIGFNLGYDGTTLKNNNFRVRLVR